MNVGLLTELQKDLLVGSQYRADSFFLPVQDYNNNWVISIFEVNNCENNQFNWLIELPVIKYIPKHISE